MRSLNFTTLVPTNVPVVATEDRGFIWGSLYELSEQQIDTSWHMHDTGILAFKESGMMGVQTQSGSYLFAPGSMIYVPPRVPHVESALGESVVGWYISVPLSISSRMPKECTVIQSSRILRALCEEIISWDPNKVRTPKELKVVDLLVETLLAATPSDSLKLPFPRTAGLLRVTQMVLADLSNQADVDFWAKEAAMSKRSFTRHFVLETGYPFSVWRQKARVLASVSMLTRGKSVQVTSEDLGYRHPSTFIALFKKHMGHSPLKYHRARLMKLKGS